MKLTFNKAYNHENCAVVTDDSGKTWGIIEPTEQGYTFYGYNEDEYDEVKLDNTNFLDVIDEVTSVVEDMHYNDI